MDRGELKRRIQGLSVRPGFSEDYLETASVEKLKKILMAAAVNARSR